MIPVDATLAGQRILALSAGGIETCYQVPEYDLCLDIGRCPPEAEKRKVLLLTHAHIDHAAGLPYYVSIRRLLGYPAPKVYVPNESLAALKKVLAAWMPLQADTDRVELIGVSAGDRIELGSDRYAIVFRSPHRIDTVGYSLCKRVKKLRPELVGLESAAIAARAQSGEEVNVVTERVEICFPGDTQIDVIDSDPSVTSARVLLLECTFLGPNESPAKAKRGGHVHLEHVIENAARFSNEVLVLTHVSRRYGRSEVEAEVRARMPSALLERTWLLTHHGPGGQGLLAPVARAPAR